MLGQKIIELRKSRGWSQSELAKQLKISSKAVKNWEDDISDPSAECIQCNLRLSIRHRYFRDYKYWLTVCPTPKEVTHDLSGIYKCIR